MFMELGPLPSRQCQRSIHLDPYGHQIGSAIDLLGQLRLAGDADIALEKLWRARWVEPVQAEAIARGASGWLRKAAAGRSIVLIALQPPGWLTYEAIGPREGPLELVRREAGRLSAGEVLVPTWHPAAPAPPDAEDLLRDLPNILIPPEPLRTNVGELFAIGADRVITISSNVAACAALLGRGVELLGRSKFAGLAAQPGRPRTELLGFLTARYCGLMADWLGVQGAFEAQLRRLARAPASLFAPITISDLDAVRRFLV